MSGAERVLRQEDARQAAPRRADPVVPADRRRAGSGGQGRMRRLLLVFLLAVLFLTLASAVVLTVVTI